ncbi:hypothetical protein ASG52_21715 [Methylobacterium sp. Leaf456]|uniref:poly(R)-hydroxyalkanoic acid synthase subunit PhaE n=1 Tax=Methylobacterium sp. Leaf456 TaxID=1736382 RepID=UPI0006F30D85|nr:poly(R)-hydroxyalkanoic acid synthase subunit PhaE [Methylobacterium sp. Leaf456]KQT58474.1 hypothetical protein ASG52_21715 [Methylobacterium sp. Leaf456]
MTGTRDGGPQAATDPFGLFGASMEAMQAWSQTWQAMLTARGGPSASLMLGAMTDPAQWSQSVAPLMEEFRRALALPRFADLPSLDAEAMPSPESAVDLTIILQQYLAAVVPVWMKACETFQEEVATRRARGESIDGLGEGMDIWNGVLDRTLMAFNRSDDFAALQQRMLRLAMRQREETRRRGEAMAQTLDLPTRSEMLDVYARLHGLMREVHGLRREVRALKAQAVGRPAEAGHDNP